MGFQTLVVYNMKWEISQRPILYYRMNKRPLIYSWHVIICIRHFTSLFPSICAVYPELTVIAVATQQVRIWHRLRIRALVLLSVAPVFASPSPPHYVDTGQKCLCLQHMGTQAKLFHFWKLEKLPWDENYFFPTTKKRRFFQIEKQITICCKLTGFSICLCWQGPCQPVCKAISQKIFCPSPLIPPPPSFLLTLLTWEMGWRW